MKSRGEQKITSHKLGAAKKPTLDDYITQNSLPLTALNSCRVRRVTANAGGGFAAKGKKNMESRSSSPSPTFE